MLSSGEDTEPLSNIVASSIYKFRLTVLEAPHGDLLSCMEMAKVADLIAFVVSANSLVDEYETSTLVDVFGQQCLSVFRSIGLPSTAVLIRTQLEHDKDNPGMCSLLLSGYVRAHNLSANQLVHVSGEGDFQIGKIDILNDPFPINERKSSNSMDSEDMNNSQTWPTEAEMAEAETNNKERKLVRKRLPQGTSDYQAAWIVEDTDDDLDLSDEDHDGMIMDEHEGQTAQEDSDHSEIDGQFISQNFDNKTIGDTEMADDENMTKEQIEAEIKKIKEAYVDDQAKKRLAKYRGLKSFRTSSWDPKESLPPEYARIFAFDNFAKTQKNVLAKMLEVDEGNMNECAPIGSYVRLYLKNVPLDVAARISLPSRKVPVLVCGLLQHESKMSVLHFRPLFSSDNLNSDKHKMERFLHAGRYSVATVYARISFPSLPLVVLKIQDGEAPAVAAIGSLKSVDPDRIILKKIILTGYPQRVSKSKSIVRYMFHNPEDVRWLKCHLKFLIHSLSDMQPLEVWTKGGRRGRITDTVGTHGAMKCIFNGVIQQSGTVCMSLYKRIYPKWPDIQ
ncbi:hypothetical protein ZIOFF_051700 [Zingiber officinale]|uniref:Uncharacterized protein n=1 Tax=Zingiber officinale TaxID=94328 RepID=A0A8J5G2R6_ZINOF|nr:hypothetical protein ZIOFF_051700 [Zingiber officinale]